MKAFTSKIGRTVIAMGVAFLVTVGYGGDAHGQTEERATPQPASDGPKNRGRPIAHEAGNATRGREIFRFETFGNDRVLD